MIATSSNLWGTPHHDARRTEGDHYSVVIVQRALNASETVAALDAEREAGWKLCAIYSHPGGSASYVLERIRD